MASIAPAAVIVMAAGKGTRMRSAIPKVLHTIGGRSLLNHAVTAARGLHPDHLVVVVRHERDAVVAHLAEVAPDAVPADQDEVPGTGRAVACGLAAVCYAEFASTVPVAGSMALSEPIWSSKVGLMVKPAPR